jgi:hypothetical protein
MPEIWEAGPAGIGDREMQGTLRMVSELFRICNRLIRFGFLTFQIYLYHAYVNLRKYLVPLYMILQFVHFRQQIRTKSYVHNGFCALT